MSDPPVRTNRGRSPEGAARPRNWRATSGPRRVRRKGRPRFQFSTWRALEMAIGRLASSSASVVPAIALAHRPPLLLNGPEVLARSRMHSRLSGAPLPRVPAGSSLRDGVNRNSSTTCSHVVVFESSAVLEAAVSSAAASITSSQPSLRTRGGGRLLAVSSCGWMSITT